MKKVIIAGAGHAGLVLASKLPASEFDVLIIEKNSRENLGHDWEDRFTFELLESVTGKSINDFPDNSWRYRGDSAFISPSKRTSVPVTYSENDKQKVMWRKPLINMLITSAEKAGARFIYNTDITGPIIAEGRVTGIKTDKEEYYADIVVDCAGVFSPVRSNLPEEYMIERNPGRGDLFYAWRAYFDKCSDINPELPFEVYMYHEREQGLSWCCTNENSVDILIGRIDKLTDEKVNEQIAIFRENHPWIGSSIINGGSYGYIPVRRPLSVMVADGYAAAGDSAFMTMPMNGMGIDLSIKAGIILSEVLAENIDKDYTADVLWEYNRRFHTECGAEASKNEGLKNAILSLPYEGVDFLFENGIIQSSDLAGAGKKTSFISLLGKLKRGLKKPKYLFAILSGIIKGSKNAGVYKNPPAVYNKEKIVQWKDQIEKNIVKIL
ncbi:MAG: NAD(P)/FAD-dependent oxidoreductase [Clostridia bacterium]|nr:NAD(P)/FAD-dependent oxidoreductase [Clostridia bacterium]